MSMCGSFARPPSEFWSVLISLINYYDVFPSFLSFLSSLFECGMGYVFCVRRVNLDSIKSIRAVLLRLVVVGRWIAAVRRLENPSQAHVNIEC